MDRLISADALKEWIENWFVMNSYYHPYSKSNNIPIPELYDILERMPTVDAEPVVRCKDCRFFHKYGFKLEYTECTHFDCDVIEDGYCWWGERREDE